MRLLLDTHVFIWWADQQENLSATALSALKDEAKRLEKSALSKREIIRRLGTSATQFYRLLDQKNYHTSVDQVLSLLHVLDCDVDLVIRAKTPSPGKAA